MECYVGTPMFSDIDGFLRQSGYQFHDFGYIGSRSFKPLTGSARSSSDPLLRAFRQKIWGDVYYVKDWMRLDRLAPSKLTKFAALLHDLLGSYDLAHLVLCEFDRQTGNDIAGRYLKRLENDGLCGVSRDTKLDGDSLPLSTGCEESGTDCNQVDAAAKPEALVLQTRDGLSISVPASLNCITTYILLEQEQWFEREVGFVQHLLKPGMNAIDIGANVGMYSLPMASAVGIGGRVIAFEPGSENRRHLEASRMANDMRNLEISACALADAEKEGWLQIADSGELNSLTEAGGNAAGAERVRVSTLDIQEEESQWPSIDFVKVDAEGQEARIVAGGRAFFDRHSPLIMYEINHAGVSNSALRWMFESLGYNTYRLLGDASCLVPVGSDELLDSFELNLFAAKPDRADSLAQQGLLVFGAEKFALTERERELALDALLDLPFARWYEFSRADVLDCAYADALLAYAACNFAGLSAVRRYSGLAAAFSILSDYCQTSPTPAGLSTLVRIALDLGSRTIAVKALGHLVAMSAMQIEQPFFPSCARYDRISLDDRDADWFVAAANEQFELSRSYSSCFADADLVRLRWLCASPFASAELGRRLILAETSARMGLADRLVDAAPPACVPQEFLDTVSQLQARGARRR